MYNNIHNIILLLLIRAVKIRQTGHTVLEIDYEYDNIIDNVNIIYFYFTICYGNNL